MPYKSFDVAGIGAVKIYKRRGTRSLRLSVAPDGEVRVSIPTWTPYQAGLSFLISRRTWLQQQSQPTRSPLYDGLLVGKQHVLRFIPDLTVNPSRTLVRTNEVIVRHHPSLDVSDQSVQSIAESACWRALKSETIQLLTPRLNDLAARHGFSYRSLNVKRMKTRWGSCDQRQNIVLNVFLIQLPWDCIEYVLLHELTHTQVLHHGADFWQAMERVLPGARGFKRAMRAHRPVLQNSPQAVA